MSQIAWIYLKRMCQYYYLYYSSPVCLANCGDYARFNERLYIFLIPEMPDISQNTKNDCAITIKSSTLSRRPHVIDNRPMTHAGMNEWLVTAAVPTISAAFDKSNQQLNPGQKTTGKNTTKLVTYVRCSNSVIAKRRLLRSALTTTKKRSCKKTSEGKCTGGMYYTLILMVINSGLRNLFRH